MANASRKHMGPGHDGKKSGTGAMTELDPSILPENAVLSNRDKSRHSEERGLDTTHIQEEQYEDSAKNRGPV